MIRNLKDIASERITAAITRGTVPRSKIKIILDPFNQVGSTNHVNFATTKTERWDTSGATNPPRSHINRVILDSDWEAEFCRVAEAHPRVRAYVKNHSLGFEVPYLPYLTVSKLLWDKTIEYTLRVYCSRFNEATGIARMDDWTSSRVKAA